MNKNEFLKKLKENLELSLDKDQIKSQVAYYDDYIKDEVAKGRKEKEVLDELGDPMLIAKTIKTVEGKNIGDGDNYCNKSDGHTYAENDYANENGENKSSTSGYTSPFGNMYTVTGANATIGCIIVFLVFFIIGSVKYALSHNGYIRCIEFLLLF